MKTKIIKLAEIVIDAGTQQRARIDESVVSEYAESIKCGAKFPPVVVFSDGVNYYLSDGFHRIGAHELAEIESIEADVHDGNLDDAILFSYGCNKSHGLRMSQADKKKAALGMINHKKWGLWTNRDIAKHIGVSHTYINKLRDQIESSQEESGNVSTSSQKSSIVQEVNKELSKSEIGQKDGNDSEQPELSESELMAEMSEEINLADELENAHKEIDRLNKIIESDDQLATAMAENKRLTELCRVIEERARGYQSSENAAVRKAKMWKEKFEKLERQVKASGLVEF